MRVWLRGAPGLLLLGAVLPGCGPGAPPPDSVHPELPRVTVEVKGMS
jgi:hypothetical protein